ncbi:MAG: hypothetical protein FWG64_13995 [Firmicutes bacterium]|nr:hypothetical protein [Bacillota bacterium]
MATITYDRTMIIGKEEADIIVEMLERPTVPIPEELIIRHEENARRGREWMKNFTKQST